MVITSSMMMAGVIVIRMMIYKEGDEDDKIMYWELGLKKCSSMGEWCLGDEGIG